MDNTQEQEVNVHTFACTNCGADLKYKPGTKHLKCDYCGTHNNIPQLDYKIQELDYHDYLHTQSKKEEVAVENFVDCGNCGATSSLEQDVTSALCPYCSTPLVIENVHTEHIIQPKSVLPFKLDKNEAKEKFKEWINGLWFAPNDLKKAVLNFDHFKGVYIPYWTFDTDTYTVYSGQRGEYYYETESYEETEDGETVTKTREVKKTKWHSVSGHVNYFFDDILTVATKSLTEDLIHELEPWDLENLVPFDKSYLSGFITEKYQVELEEGFETAKNLTNDKISDLVKSDIGGDEQRVTSVSTIYSDITFKHILLPVFVSAYRFKGKLYQFLINGRTGEVQGERPYSLIKIVFTIILILFIIGLIYYLTNSQ